MKTNQSHLVAAALTCALASTITAARADDAMSVPTPTSPEVAPPVPALTPAEDPNPWQFGVTVPLWAPAIDGTVTARGRQVDANVSFSELKDHLDASFSLAANVQKGKFGMFGNVGYMKFDGSRGDSIGGHTDWTLKFLVANSGLSYQLLKTDWERTFLLTGTVGVRFWYVSTDLDHHDGFGTRDFHGYNNMNLFDPVIGLRATQYLTKKLHLDVAGDGGGFNISYDTDWTWSVSGMLSYDFCKNFTLSAGYQALSLDVSNGSGSNKNGVNLIFNGVAIGATFKF